MFACISVYVCVCTMCTPGAQGGQKRVSDPQELELQAVVSRHVDAGNHTVRCKKSCRYSSWWAAFQPNLKLFHKAKMDKNLMTGTTATYVPFLSVYMCGLGVRCMCLQRPTSDIFLYSSHLCSETRSPADLELAASARLGASKPSESASVPPNLSSARYSYVLLCLALMCMLGIQIQIECLHSTL